MSILKKTYQIPCFNVYALKIFDQEKKQETGFLLFKNKESAVDFLLLFKQIKHQYIDSKNTKYQRYGFIKVNGFYFDAIMKKGNFFIKNLDQKI